jgi:hypothetical protein
METVSKSRACREASSNPTHLVVQKIVRQPSALLPKERLYRTQIGRAQASSLHQEGAPLGARI